MRFWNPIPRSPGSAARREGFVALATHFAGHPRGRGSYTAGRSDRAFTLLEVCAVASAVLLLLIVGLSFLWQTQRRTGRNPLQCQQNLKQIGVALQEFRADHEDRYPWDVPNSEGGSLESLAGGQATPHFRSLTNNIRNARVFLCPMDPIRRRGATLATLDDSAISYFVNASANAGPKSQIIGGDRTISPSDDTTTGELKVAAQSPLRWAFPAPDETGHTTVDTQERTGNLLFNNGSLIEATTPQLQKILRSLGTATNRFILP